ncbi:putative nucleotidyltransferase substrate binding domain-containing protein [Aquisalimonas sp.]|uniref:putative nucleotidyltransferase substrate binding domain-containing protein n=1 Tax=Aquisalimonas sp. TaxID=1872621 RepID=UPI0025BF3EDE|nr:putative nucleotidyltransferase substrate binding domain-containing protein [Aquisalimonas sp.]
MNDVLPRSSDHQRIAEAPLWRALEPETIDAMLSAGEEIRLQAGRYLFRAGDAYRKCIFIHLDGHLEQTSANGATRTAESGDLIGLASYLDSDHYRSTAQAVTDCRLLALPGATVHRLEQESTAFFEAINRALASRMRKARQVRETVRGTLARPVKQFMGSGLPTCRAGDTVADAARMLAARNISSLGLVDDQGRLTGLVTPTSLLSVLATGGAKPSDLVYSLPSEPAYTVTPETPLWQVEELQRRHGVHEVVVVDHANSPVGLISKTGLIEALSRPPYTLESEIKAAPDIDTLVQLRRKIPVAAGAVHEAHRSAATAVRALTEMHLALQHRLIELIVDTMYREGLGRPPARFAVIVMGSGGRGEMLLRPDQDNGLIIDDWVDAKGLAWFQDFSERLNPALDQIGYRICPGDVMARNAEYRRTLTSWKGKLDRLISEPGRNEARRANIILDFATLYGDDNLTSQLRTHLNQQLADDRGKMLFRMMVSDDAKIAQPLGFFNRLVTTTHRGSQVIDIKRTGLRILVDGMRVFALKEGISRCKTIERLASLRRLGVFDSEFSESMRIAFEGLQDLLLVHQLDQVERGETPDPLVRMDRLSSDDREHLRIFLRATRRMRERLQYTFGMVMH